MVLHIFHDFMNCHGVFSLWHLYCHSSKSGAPNLPYYLTYNCLEKRWIYAFLKDINTKQRRSRGRFHILLILSEFYLQCRWWCLSITGHYVSSQIKRTWDIIHVLNIYTHFLVSLLNISVDSLSVAKYRRLIHSHLWKQMVLNFFINI